MRMMDHISTLRLFVRVACTKSFSQAARELNLSQPTASRMIALLEQRLGATLFSRTTRAVVLTEAGTEYVARIRAILSALEEADHMVRGTNELRGLLRIGASSTFTSRAVMPRLPAFGELHPALRIEVKVEDLRQDLIAEGIDVALRFGPLPDSSAKTRRIGSWPRILVAAPSYLARRGTPETPADLAAHDVVVDGPSSGTQWTFRRDGVEQSIDINGRLLVSSSEAAISAAAAGFGVLATLAPAFDDELKGGRLIRLLPDWDMGSADVHALFPSGQTAKPSARAFTDYLAQNAMAH